jgi:hypothetical protein
MRILSLSVNEILEETRILDREARQIKENLIKMCWYMRGSLTIDDAWALSTEEREIINALIKENLETTKKTGMPFF